jgi:uncharacterized protein
VDRPKFAKKRQPLAKCTITALNIYPLKSGAAQPLSQASLYESGFQGDRQFMLVDQKGTFVTQRKYPWMAKIEVRAHEADLSLKYNEETLKVDLNGRRPERRVRVWRDEVSAFDLGAEVSDFLRQVLPTKDTLSFVMFDDKNPRLVPQKYRHGTQARMAFADGLPYLVCNEDSLMNLNSRLAVKGDREIPMNRFRPNIVIQGLTAFEEDSLAGIRVGGSEIKFVKPCIRCTITTVDQALGLASPQKEPLKTLGEYRNLKELGGIAFGQNAILTEGAGQEIAVGDSFEPIFRVE